MQSTVFKLTSRICMVLMLIFFHQIGSANTDYRWKPMEITKTSSFYFPYELCVMGLNDSSYDKSATIFRQPLCMHHLTPDTNLLSKISTRCWLGGKQQRQDDGICVGDAGGSEVKRGRKKHFCFALSERKGILHEWTGLPTPKVSYTIDLLNALIDKKYGLVTFVGDSMANQLGQRLLCTALRSQLTVAEYGEFFSMPPTGASALIANIPESSNNSSVTRRILVSSYRLHNGLGCTTLHDRQSGSIPGVTKACTIGGDVLNRTCAKEIQSQFIYSKTLNGFRIGPKWANSLNVFVLPIRLKFAWEYLPFGQAIYEVAQQMKLHNSSLIITSPFAQHFKSHPLGLYENFTKPEYEERSCGPHVSDITLDPNFDHPESVAFKAAMNSIDPNWESLVLFFNLFPFTAPMHDLHSEGHSTGWSVDCTHYFFQPTMFDAIWSELTHLFHHKL